MAVVLIATAVSGAKEYLINNFLTSYLQLICALNEWEDGQRRNVSFSANQYHAVYLSIIQLVEDINQDTYHKAKFTWAHQLWACCGGLVLFYILLTMTDIPLQFTG